MFRKQDFKKLDLLESGKRNTKIYKVQHLTTGLIYCLKEVETKSFEKLNEYKEEAVQLSKIQNLPNVLKFYGYFFYQTNYNAYRMSIVTEYMDPSQNLETLYNARLKTKQYWAEKELTVFMFSLISTCSLLQQKGVCHRDIKPANLFMLSNNEAKLIDFGESKDYFLDLENKEKSGYTMATIRGTPQYLSPILWRSHVLEGNNQYTQHNIYKSDVFSAGLVICQIAMLKEVTGFNYNKGKESGEELIKHALVNIEKLYGRDFASIVAILLTFEERQRPSFVELEYIFLEHEANSNNTTINTASTVNSDSKAGTMGTTASKKTVSFYAKLPKNNNLIKQYNKEYNSFSRNSSQSVLSGTLSKGSGLASPLRGNRLASARNPISASQRRNLNKSCEFEQVNKDEESLFFDYRGRAYYPSVYWFEYGGTTIAKFYFEIEKWKTVGNYDQVFPLHFTALSIKKKETFYLIGGTNKNNVLEFSGQTLKILKKKNMIRSRNFFGSVYMQNRIYVFGGYDDTSKTQMKHCECYDLESETWRELADLSVERSQTAACCFSNEKIYVVGGYNSKLGTIRSIEEYLVKEDKFKLLELSLYEGLRRLSVRSWQGEVIVFGGVKQQFENNETVYRVNIEEGVMEEYGSLDKGGVVEYEVLVSGESIYHLFLEESNGTSPPFHLKFRSQKVLDEV